MEKLPDLNTLQSRVFTNVGGTIYIGKERVTDDIRSLLRQEARYLETSRFWEIFNATIINESSDLALKQSTEWSHVLSAKQLHHWGHVFRNMIHVLRQD